jgi:peptide subunit release factor RF-3
MFLSHENVIVVIAKHDEKLLLQLLMEVNKLLMFERAKITFNFHLKGDFKGLLHPTSTTTDIFKDIVSKEVVGFWWFPIDVESNNCALF